MDNIFSGRTGRVAESEEILGADQWAYGYSAALQSPDDPPYPQFNMHGSSQMSCPPMNGQPSQGLSIDNNHGSQPPSLQSQKIANKRNVSRRGTAFSKEEDLVVCSAFLNISKDPITGVKSNFRWLLQEDAQIQRDLFNLQKKHIKMTLQQLKKKNKIREKESEAQLKESEAQLITAESSIMLVDMEKVPPHLKDYYVGMQRKIMESRGFVSPSNNKD